MPLADRREPCAEGSDAHRAAGDRLRRFADLVQALRDTDAVEAPRRRLQDLLQSPCFTLAYESRRIPWPDSVPALKDWLERGGDWWLSSYLELPTLGVVPALEPHVVLPPDPRPTLRSGGGPQPRALDRWLCRDGDTACGDATRGWVARAEQAIRQHVLAARADTTSLFDEQRRTPAETSAACASETREHGDGYPGFRACLENARPVQPLVPIARFRAPDAGWLIVAGRRGHYDFCDEVAAYDLATGRAFVDASCSALALERDGTVDRDRTNMRRRHDTHVGTVSTEHLREAAWMLTFRSQFIAGQFTTAAFPLPADLGREWATDRSPDHFAMTGFGVTGSTAQTALTWMLVVPDGPSLAGTVTWPSSFQAADDHAVQLLTVAEAGLVRGCRVGLPPARLPATPVVVDDFVGPDDIERLQTDLSAAHRVWAALPPCR